MTQTASAAGDTQAAPSPLAVPEPVAGHGHVFYPWSAQAVIKPMVIAGAEGSYIFDDDGKRYLDFSCQLVNTNIGHQHPKVVAAIKAQADRLCTVEPAARQRRRETRPPV